MSEIRGEENAVSLPVTVHDFQQNSIYLNYLLMARMSVAY